MILNVVLEETIVLNEPPNQTPSKGENSSYDTEENTETLMEIRDIALVIEELDKINVGMLDQLGKLDMNEKEQSAPPDQLPIRWLDYPQPHTNSPEQAEMVPLDITGKNELEFLIGYYLPDIPRLFEPGNNHFCPDIPEPTSEDSIESISNSILDSLLTNVDYINWALEIWFPVNWEKLEKDDRNYFLTSVKKNIEDGIITLPKENLMVSDYLKFTQGIRNIASYEIYKKVVFDEMYKKGVIEMETYKHDYSIPMSHRIPGFSHCLQSWMPTLISYKIDGII